MYNALGNNAVRKFCLILGVYLFAHKKSDYMSLADEAIKIAKKFEAYLEED